MRFDRPPDPAHVYLSFVATKLCDFQVTLLVPLLLRGGDLGGPRIKPRPLAIVALVFGLSTPAYAGPIIIDGTDRNDHGTVSEGVNQDGWFYMQRVLENLAGGLTGSFSKTVVNLGADAATQSGFAIASAFGLSSLPGDGWAISNVTGGAAMGTYLDTISTASTGILAISTVGNSAGDIGGTEVTALNSHATQIAAFVNSGGALWAMGESGRARGAG